MKYLTEKDAVICTENGNEIGRVSFYRTEDGIYDIDRTYVHESMQGKGIAAQLMRRALCEIALRGGEVRASCSYAKRYIEKNGLRPAVICHMMTSIDGKVTGDFLCGAKGQAVCEVYYDINRRLKGDAFACGRVTMESSFTNGFRPDLSPFAEADVPDGDYIAQKHSYYAVSFDSYGNVGWTDSRIHDPDPGYDDCHIIEVVTKKTPKAMLAYYRSIGVSYIFAGTERVDISTALQKLYSSFGIKKLLLEGGSIINGAFLRADMIDELSLVVAPMTADKDDKPLFKDAFMCEFGLTDIEQMEAGAAWMRYVR